MWHIEKRLSYLYTGELFSSIIFIVTSFFVNQTFPGLKLYSLLSFWSSFIYLEFLLLQGTVYWYVKWKRLKTEKNSVTPIKLVKQLKSLIKWNIAWMIAAPVGFIVDVVKWAPALPISGLSVSAFIYIFACIEYINYFHVQLSYDNRSDLKYLFITRRLKQSCLRKDFKRLSRGQNTILTKKITHDV